MALLVLLAKPNLNKLSTITLMKKTIQFITIVLFLFLTFTACDSGTSEITPNGDIKVTSLEIMLKDELGNVVSGASVKLYASQTDWAQKTNQVGTTVFSDETGKVTFTNLSAIKYYWFAEKDAKNNYNGGVSTKTALTADVKTTVNVILTSTGTLKFVNSSSDNYKIYINGTDAGNVAGKTTIYKYYSPIGSYSIRALQLDGYILYATDKTYTGTLTAGGTISTTFP